MNDIYCGSCGQIMSTFHQCQAVEAQQKLDDDHTAAIVEKLTARIAALEGALINADSVLHRISTNAPLNIDESIAVEKAIDGAQAALAGGKE